MSGQSGVPDSAQLLQDLFQLDWDFAGHDTAAGGHDLHPYPAKFPPQIPRCLIEHLSMPGDTVLDPFGGSGTTALEAKRQRRSSVSVDANPIAALIASVKVDPPSKAELEELRASADNGASMLREIAECDYRRCSLIHRLTPRISNQDKWFAPTSVHELCHLRNLVLSWRSKARELGILALGQTASAVSYQESETRYVSVPREVRQGEAVSRFVRELRRLLNSLDRVPQKDPPDFMSVVADARLREQLPLVDNSVDLVVTSPPYPNAYDYHLYHRFRLLWSGYSPADLRRVEIGSHLRQQAILDPVGDYEADISQVLASCLELMKPAAWAVFVVGDGKYRGKIYQTSEALAKLAVLAGFQHVGTLSRNLPNNRRSITSVGRRLVTEQLVFLQKPAAPEVTFLDPTWPMFDYERVLAERERTASGFGRGTDRTAWQRLAFAKAVTLPDRSLLTTQFLLESHSRSKRKNSTYSTHGIHRYKGKFYPQLGRCLLNLSCEPGSLVVDPFAGSGTVLLEAALAGLRSHGIELNPVGAATARSKVNSLKLNPCSLKRATEHFEKQLAREPLRIPKWDVFDTRVRAEIESWFPTKVVVRLSLVLEAINLLSATESEDRYVLIELARVCLSDLIREVSHQDPSDLRIRRRAVQLEDAPVESEFLRRWRRAVAGILWTQASLPTLEIENDVVCASSTELSAWPCGEGGDDQPVDAIVTSPPYAAALPYIDTDRLSLAAVFGTTRNERSSLESILIGSREISTRDQRSWSESLREGLLNANLPSSTTAFLTALLDAVENDKKAGFRKQQSPAVLARYFAMMSRVLQNAARRLKSGADAWIIMGDSKTNVAGHQWVIPTTAEVAAIGKQHGLVLTESISITVTRENMKHAKNAIRNNTLLRLTAK